MCAGWWWGIYEINDVTDAPGLYSLWFDGHAFSGGFYSIGIFRDAGSSLYLTSQDIACVGNQRTIIGWLEKNGAAPAHAKVRIDSLPSIFAGGPSFHVDLGAARLDGGLAVAASDTRAYAGWFQGSHFRFKSFSMAAGPGHAMAGHPTVTLFDAADAYNPVMAADGSTVVLSYARNSDTWVRVSRDSGSTWSAAHRLINLPPDLPDNALPSSVDVRGSRVAIEVTEAYNTDNQNSHEWRFLSSDRGAHWSQSHPGDDGERLGAFISIGGATRLAETWDQSYVQLPPLHQKLWFHREN